MLTIDGLVTGIDTEAIVAGLLEIQQKQIDTLQGRSDKVAVQQGAFQAIQTQLQSLRSTASALSRSQNSVFDARQVNVSDEDAIVATASSKAASGVYQIRVGSLAQAHQVASQGFAEADSAISQGTLTLQQGSASPVTLTIDSSNDTLEGLATAINNSDSGVSATIIQDGSGAGAAYRLLLTGSKTGASNAISLTNNLAATGGGATQPAFDLDNPVQDAADASVTLGGGAGAITVQSASNTISTVISGVSLTLRQADIDKNISISVEPETEAATTAVQDFVDSYNELIEFVGNLSKFNPESGEGGVLIGNRNVTGIQQIVRSAILDTVPGLDGNANRLTALGVSVNDDGSLAFNASTLEDALQGRREDLAPADLKRLFALDGQSSHASVRFINGSARTQASSTPYQIDITQAAEKASVTATNTLAASIDITDLNNTLNLSVDGADSGALTLSQGTYTQQELANHIESVLNSASSLTGRNLSVSVESDRLVVTSDTYGTKSAVTIGSGTANATLGFSGGEADTGQDVAGTFLVDGVVESATGRGQLLSGVSENENTADLQVRISLTGADVVAGAEAEITVTRGLAARLDQVLNDILDPVTGRLKTIDQGFDDTISSLQQSIDRQKFAFERQREAIVREFISLETAISELNSTSSFLGAQLAGLSGAKK